MKISVVKKFMEELEAQGETDVIIAWRDRFFVAEQEDMEISKEDFSVIADIADDMSWEDNNIRIGEITRDHFES
jgi:hypothetical protein